MTYSEKIKQLYEQALSVQREFLWVVVEIRTCAQTGKAIEEAMLDKRDALYEEYNRILDAHRTVRDYCHTNEIPMEDQVAEDLEGLN